MNTVRPVPVAGLRWPPRLSHLLVVLLLAPFGRGGFYTERTGGVACSAGDGPDFSLRVPSPELHQAVLHMLWLWQWFLAQFRLSESAVCGMSRGRGLTDDYHDYPDSEEGLPWHFHVMTCKRCGKRFTI